MSSHDEISEILAGVKPLAIRYRQLTGKPLGVTGEVAEYEAARILGLDLARARQAGYDATERIRQGTRLLQIKGRSLVPGSKKSQRVGSIRLDAKCDAVLLVLLDDNLAAVAIYEADYEAVRMALTAPGSKARNERGSLGVGKFISIGRARWKREG